MSPVSLTQYFRSFLVKLSMIEAQMGQLHLGGELCPQSIDVLLNNLMVD